MKYKVGDKAIVKSVKHGHSFPIGTVVTVKKVNVQDKDYSCSDDNGGTWYRKDSELLSVLRGTAVIKPTRNGQFRFNLVGVNGEKVATSETYTTKAMAVETLNRLFPEFEIKNK